MAQSANLAFWTVPESTGDLLCQKQALGKVNLTSCFDGVSGWG